MIAIHQINPLDSSKSTTIDALRWPYFDRIQNTGNTNPYKILDSAINAGTLYNYTLGAQEIALLQFLKKHINCLIIGDPLVLKAVIEKVNNSGWQDLIYNDGTTPLGNALLKAFGYTTRFRSVQQKGVWLAKNLNIKSCPYCNAQYTLVVNAGDNKGIAKFQFDHFFPKEKYPYLSVSLYNLIPSCASCNHRKSNEDVALSTHYNPYYIELAPFSYFKLSVPAGIDLKNFKSVRSLKPSEIKIQFKSKFPEMENFVDAHERLFDINGIYERHTDIAHEVLINSFLVNKSYRKGALKIDGLFPDDATMLRYILGTYVNENEILNRPLSKFKQDIAKQLKIL